MPTLAVNIDHVATLRQQRRGAFPDPVQAAATARRTGADAIIAHLREDRRHVQDADVRAIAVQATPFHFEMAASWEMRALALEVRPRLVCLVPEKREELTTEGGLAVAGRVPFFVDYCAPLHAAGIGVSLFIEAAADQVEAAKAAGAQYVELHTGHYADAADPAAREAEFRRILDAIRLGRDLGLVVNLGHGLDLDNILPFRDVAGVNEYSIGFSIIARAVFVGLETAVREMLELIRTFPDEAGRTA